MSENSQAAVAVNKTLTSTTVKVSSSGERARVIASFRGQHLVSDGPIYAGGPAEAAAPTELMLSSLGSCALCMMDLACARDGIPLKRSAVDIESKFGSSSRSVDGESVKTFDEVTLKFTFEGISGEQAAKLVGMFHANCPIYGSLKVATTRMTTEVEIR